MVDSLAPDAAKVAALREALPATGAGIYLDTATRGPLPAEAAAAMREADDWELRVGRATAGRDDDAAQRAEEARAVVAALVTAQPSEIALYPGTGLALTVAALGERWRPGDRALAMGHQGAALAAALAGLRRLHGVEADVIELADAADDKAALAAIEAAVGPRTRLLLLPVVSPATGLRLPIAAAAEVCLRSDAWLVVDASQAAGAVPLAAADLGADIVCFATDTWPLGPEGTAAAWVGPRALAEARPPLVRAGAEEAADARRLEAGELPRTTLLGLARSVGWLEMYVGLEWAHERAASLAATAHEMIGAIDGVEMLTPRSSMATIVTFRVGGWTAQEVADELGRRVFAIVGTAASRNAVRASVAWFNTDDEVERLVDALRLLAAHTPATLPRGPSLVVVPGASSPTDEP